MKVPLSWMREFVDVTVEVSKLAEDLTLIGLAVDGVETHEGDNQQVKSGSRAHHTPLGNSTRIPLKWKL